MFVDVYDSPVIYHTNGNSSIGRCCISYLRRRLSIATLVYDLLKHLADKYVSIGNYIPPPGGSKKWLIGGLGFEWG